MSERTGPSVEEIRALIYELAGKRPSNNRDGEEPVWVLDVFEFERRLAILEKHGGAA